jgi:hypothetical protein
MHRMRTTYLELALFLLVVVIILIVFFKFV